MDTIAMIPARMGSQRLKQKNLLPLHGEALIVHAIRKCKAAGVFDAVFVNSEHEAFGEIAIAEGVRFHKRPEDLGTNEATSEQFVAEFLEKNPCRLLFQVHSIAPLLTMSEVQAFVRHMQAGEADVLLSVVNEQLEALIGDKPINFTFDRKTNSQELEPVSRISWSITGWRSATYLQAARAGSCATYSGKVATYPINRWAGHVIKTAEDLAIADVLYPIVIGSKQ